ncbi:MAG TPA: TIGR03087 family PEP-CTERM/XrtA system glycosyltransferase [Candidatus Limnocylindrales bacterium]|nr:TIGR03087 family PEP-CTERM/XrtA system glycosyltransferase [Candidatus Limnocylindrales bacterium]
MKILFIAHRIPYPPNKGDKIRSFNEIKYLSERHSISLMCLADEASDLTYKDELKKYCENVEVVFLNKRYARLKSLISLPLGKPLSLPYFFSKTLQQKIDRELRDNSYDLIFVFSSAMAQYVLPVCHIPKIMDFVDVDSEKWLQYARYTPFPFSAIYKLEGKRLRDYEKFIAQQFQQSIFVSESEANLFRSFFGPVGATSTSSDSIPAISAISNGLDYHYFKPMPEHREAASLVFTGAMDYLANVDGVLYFRNEILPRIKKEIPEVRFYIVGMNPVRKIRRLEKEDQNIVVTGFVKDTRQYLSKATVFVAPLRIARGIQNKVLEAMAMGIPVVATSVAFDGIKAIPGEALFVEDDPQEFASKVIRLIKDPLLREKISLRARETIEAQYDWTQSMNHLEEILKGLINGERKMTKIYVHL